MSLIDLDALVGHMPGPWQVFPAKAGLMSVVACSDREFNEFVTIAQATPGNAPLIAAAPALLAELAACRARVAELERELESVRRDAERYRWLRDCDDVLVFIRPDENPIEFTGAPFDAFIDTARGG